MLTTTVHYVHNCTYYTASRYANSKLGNIVQPYKHLEVKMPEVILINSIDYFALVHLYTCSCCAELAPLYTLSVMSVDLPIVVDSETDNETVIIEGSPLNPLKSRKDW